MRLTRRRVLAAAAGVLAAGCARARPASRHPGVVLNIRCDALTMAAPAIRAAWAEAHPGVGLNITPLLAVPELTGSSSTRSTGWTAQELIKDDDVLQMQGDGELGFQAEVLDLTPLLRARNFALSNLSVPSAFVDQGRQYGLPLWVDPMALLVNTRLATRLGIDLPSASWTLNDMEAAVEQAVLQQGGVGPNLIVGYPWTDVRIWGGFVVGFGGSLTNADGGLDFTGPAAAAATSSLIHLAQQAGWYSGIGPGSARFVGADFTGALADTLFAMQTVPFYLRGKLRSGLPLTRFPLLPINPIIPVAYAYGLSISPQSKNIDQALTFMLWLYEPAQQKALMAVGVPPIVRDPALQTAFQSEKNLPANVPSIADPRHLEDVQAPLPEIVEGLGYSRSLAPGLSKALKDPAQIPTALTQIQDSLEQQITNTVAACAKMPVPPRC